MNASSATACLVAVGSELLLPTGRDTNTLWLAGECYDRGLVVVARAIVGDGVDEIAATLEAALETADLIVVTGGLGPTHDDATREALAAATGRELQRSDEAVRLVRRAQRSAGAPVTEAAMSQADLPRGARLVPNDRGTAPGVWLEHDGRCVVLLPGVPSEMRAMWRSSIAPLVEERWPGTAPHRRLLRTVGLGESEVGRRLPPELPPGVSRTILAHPGAVDVHYLGWTATGEAVQQAHAAARGTLEGHVYTEAWEELEEVVVRSLVARGESLALAESCTGGLVGHRITQVPGASGCLRAGWIVYSNEAKVFQLGLDPEILAKEGAVSEPVARHLASASAERAGADWGIGITGIAGPGGGSEEKPVGTVHIAAGRCRRRAVHQRCRFHGDRAEIKQRSATKALELLWQEIRPGRS